MCQISRIVCLASILTLAGCQAWNPSQTAATPSPLQAISQPDKPTIIESEIVRTGATVFQKTTTPTVRSLPETVRPVDQAAPLTTHQSPVESSVHDNSVAGMTHDHHFFTTPSSLALSNFIALQEAPDTNSATSHHLDPHSVANNVDQANNLFLELPELNQQDTVLPSELLPHSGPRLWQDIKSDYANFYSGTNLCYLGSGIGIGAIFANTAIDKNLQETYQENIRSSHTDEFYESLHFSKIFGEGTYLLPIYGVATITHFWTTEGQLGNQFGEWGERSLRAFAVGSPQVLLWQHLTGGSRPYETAHGSHWDFWKDDNGVSGHAFMGALPFLTAAQMTEQPYLKGTLYVASTLTAISRVNDDAHYSSQAILGWWFAYLAVSSVSQTEQDNHSYRIVPFQAANGTGLGIEWRR